MDGMYACHTYACVFKVLCVRVFCMSLCIWDQLGAVLCMYIVFLTEEVM